VRAFADTNVIVYAQSDDGRKTATAIKLLETGPVISTQVVNETVAVLTRKYRFSLADAHQVAMIASAALLAGCDTLHSEDMQDGLVIEDKLKVVNPFKEAVAGRA